MTEIISLPYRINGADLRAALAALPEPPEQPSITYRDVSGNFSLGVLQARPLHADHVFFEVSSDGNTWDREESEVLPGSGSSTQIVLAPGETIQARFVAVNPNGDSPGEPLICSN